jgi:PAS domain-containing protein
MAQREIEIILARQLAEHLALSIFLVDPEGNLIFYNEPAGKILGYNFDETGPMPASEWATIFKPMNRHEQLLQPEELPLVIATLKRHPAHRNFWIRGMDDEMRQIEVTAFPLIGQADRFLGAMAIFWEVKDGG